MNMYLVTADQHGYDQYGSFVIWASSESEAVKLAEVEADNLPDKRRQEWTASVLTQPETARVVLGSFHAG